MATDLQRCPGCGRKLNRAELLWTATHGGRQCARCWAGVQFLATPGREHPHASRTKKGAAPRRGDRRLAA
jgi:hypothetical protein